MIEGFVDGMIEYWNSSGQGRVTQLTDAMLQTFKAGLRVKSPSEATYEIGSDTGQGLILALLDKVNPTRSAAEELARAVMDPLSKIEAADLVLGATVDGTPGAIVWRREPGETPTPPAPARVPIPGSPPAPAPSGSDAAIVAELRALREDNDRNAEAQERLLELLANNVEGMSPRLRRDLMYMFKNAPEARQQIMSGQATELEHKLLVGR